MAMVGFELPFDLEILTYIAEGLTIIWFGYNFINLIVHVGPTLSLTVTAPNQVICQPVQCNGQLYLGHNNNGQCYYQGLNLASCYVNRITFGLFN